MAEEVSLDDTMEETLAEIKGRGAEEEPVEEAPEETPEEAPEEPVEEEPAEEEPVEEVLPPAAVIGENAIEQEEIPENLRNPPTTWRPKSKAEWDKIPVLIREEIKKRESDMLQGVNALNERASFGDRIDAVIKPYQPLWQAEGGTPETVVGEMMNSAFILRQGSMQQKVQMTAQLAQQYGFFNELRSLLVQGVAPPPSPGLTPAEVERMVNERLQAEREQQTTAGIETEVTRFRDAANEDGSLAHPYFENVRGTMASMIEAGQAETLEDAYERAIWADPETRALLQQQQAKEGQAKEHVEKAKKANANNLRKKPSHATEQPSPTGSVDDTLAETLADIKARSA